jgi:rare lipoprotein A
MTVAATTAVMAAMPGESFAGSPQAKTEARHQAGKQRASSSRTLRNAYASLGPSRHAGRSFSGIASYYGNNVGNKTASGQRFNENAMTAAHRHLPFGTKVKVTHRNRSVVVTINDRGPFIRGRVIDLSKGAARVIGLTGRGVGHVVAEVQ